MKNKTKMRKNNLKFKIKKMFQDFKILNSF